MKIERHIDGSTEVIADGRGLSRFLLGGFLLFSSLAVYHFMVGAANNEQLTGSICAAVLFLVVYLVAYESSRFVFKQNRRVIEWRRRTLFSRQSGQVPFDAVASVVAEATVDQSPTSGRGISRRLVLHTATGAIPFTRAYVGDPDGELLRIAAQLNALFGRDAAAEILTRIRELVAAGRETEAVRLIRAERGISLKEAREELTRLSVGKGDTQGIDATGVSGTNTRSKDRRQNSLPPDAMAALTRGNKIDAIKHVRLAHGLGLKEAKDVVDRYLQEERPDMQRRMTASNAERARNGISLLLLAAAAVSLAYYLFFLQ